MREYAQHCFEPVFDSSSRVLLLGTMPSPASREYGFYYSHPRNRMWRVLAHITGEPLPGTPQEKQALLLRHHIAMWDVLSSCEIDGAADASIRDARANDITLITKSAHIEKIGCTGTVAAQLYARLCQKQTGMTAYRLPSTSPANCSVTTEALIKAYSELLSEI